MQTLLIERMGQGFAFDALLASAYKGHHACLGHPRWRWRKKGHNVPYAYNRKGRKDHGEGDVLVGAPLEGKRVVIVDDVISAGTSVRESVEMLRAAGATPVAGIDRAGSHGKSGNATGGGRFFCGSIGGKRISVFRFRGRDACDLMERIWMRNPAPELVQYQAAVKTYRERYGV